MLLLVGLGHSELTNQGSGLSPNLYTKEILVPAILKKTCSEKGPYELFSGKRNDKINIGSIRKNFEVIPYTTTERNIGPGISKVYYSSSCYTQMGRHRAVYTVDRLI